eukprot:UC1_evm2s1561
MECRSRALSTTRMVLTASLPLVLLLCVSSAMCSSASLWTDGGQQTGLSLTNGGSGVWCGRQGVLVGGQIEQTARPEFVSTAPLAGQTGLFLQMDVAVTCTGVEPSSSSSSNAARLALYFSNDGSRWVTPTNCYYGKCRDAYGWPAGGSITAQNLNDGWNRLTFPVPAQFTSGNVYVRLQELTSVSSSSTRNRPVFALDNIVLTADCPGGCGGHGSCLLGNGGGGSCKCDAGAVKSPDGSTCVLAGGGAKAAMLFTETFEEITLPLDGVRVMGGSLQRGTPCSDFSSSQVLVFDGTTSERSMTMTRDVDATHGAVLDVTIRLGQSSSTCRGPSYSSEALAVSFSEDQGITWRMAQQVSHYSYGKGGRLSVTLDRQFYSATLRARIHQFSYSAGTSSDRWAIDDFSLQGLPAIGAGLSQVSLAFTAAGAPERSDLATVVDGVYQSAYCGVPAITFDADSNLAGFETLATDLPAGSSLHFDISFGCNSVSAGRAQLEYSNRDSSTWTKFASTCNPLSSTKCRSWGNLNVPVVRGSYLGPGWHRISVTLPATTATSATAGRRYRLISAFAGEWAVSRVYIGAACGADNCNGHGNCYSGVCTCDTGFVRKSLPSGSTCVAKSGSLATRLQDSFPTLSLNAMHWNRVAGGGVTADNGGCGPLSDDYSVHFDGSTASGRFAMTTDISTLQSQFIEARIRISSSVATGSCSLPSVSAESVAVAYSIDGGQNWHYLGVRYYYQRTVFWQADLPSQAQAPAARFSFWQPSYSNSNQDEWSLDDVFVGYRSTDYPKMLTEDFAQGITTELFLHHPWVNVEKGYCQAGSSEPSAVFRHTDSELTTRDLDLSGPSPL